MKAFLTNGPKKDIVKKATNADNHNHPNGILKSGLTKEEAVDEIDKLQKDILSMQTMKEFTKSAYESGLAKFSEIENNIIEMQQRVCDLQDEFKVVKDIEDDEARAIMAEAALKSCEESLAMLQAKHDESSHKTRFERERVQGAKQKLESLKHEYLQCTNDHHGHDPVHDHEHESEQNEIQEKIKEALEELSKKPLTVKEMADMIDKLVNTVIGLETLVSSQSALIDRLRTETDDLHIQIQNMEQDKLANSTGATHDLAKSFKEVEKKLDGVQDLGMSIENQNNRLKIQFTEAHCNVHHLFEHIHDVKRDEDFTLTECSTNDEEIKPTTGSSPTRVPLPLNLTQKERVEEKDNNCENDDVANESVTNSEITCEEFKLSEPSTNGEEIKLTTGSSPKCVRLPLNSMLKERVQEKENNCANDDVANNNMISLETADVVLKHSKSEEMNWQELLSGGLDDKQKVLLQEYTTILRKYKAARKELADEERKNQETIDEMKALLAKQDNEIQQMKQKLKILQEVDQEQEVNEETDIKSMLIDKPEPVSEIEAKLRTDIDAILDENLDFWLRFSSTFHQVQKFKTEVEDLQQEIVKVKAKGSDGKTSIRSDINAIFKHLKEIQTELTIWLEQSALLKDELQRRFTSLFDIQEEIKRALREGVEEDEIKFNTHQAAKFQGEVSNMQQENTKVNQELEAGLNHVTALQLETEKTLKRLEDEFSLSDQKQPRSPNRPHVPLRSFLFGAKSKKQKPSILACINPHKKLAASNIM
ncbi:hypothetical protein M8C21_006336 [Ambrosia artemisiifolia]|uniref:Uncharacterized protein n=1 Tax=Ambrosia artemisiifolia TaxID=4212 RepID=A0AAD5GS75_AMBAR|nr:hypothetical protein M8C21_006336 [Ambrosia artemisiifolia]